MLSESLNQHIYKIIKDRDFSRNFSAIADDSLNVQHFIVLAIFYIFASLKRPFEPLTPRKQLFLIKL